MASNQFNDKIVDKLDDLEEQLQRLYWFIEFHLGEVPERYRKAFPAKGEYPYFKTKTDFKVGKLEGGILPEFTHLNEDSEKLNDPKERARALEAMRKYAKQESSEAALTSQEEQDSPQEHTFGEPCQSLQEERVH
jgi:hypothetical protein